MKVDERRIEELCRLIRIWILESTHAAESGHPTSSLSAVELMASLFFTGRLRYDSQHPDLSTNDRVIFSKGHASPLFYALWAAAGAIDADDLTTYRGFRSRLEGHPTSRFLHTEAATGSLGQGLSIGVGMAMAAKLDQLPYRTYVLLGDSEMAEGSQWEAIQIAAQNGLDNLVGILDVNRLGQRGPTQFGHDLSAYARRLEAFGWSVATVEDGHDVAEVTDALETVVSADAPAMLVANTIKGKGVSFLEDEEGWHGKALDDERFEQSLKEIRDVDRTARESIASPERVPGERRTARSLLTFEYEVGQLVATRDAFGAALRRLAPAWPDLVVLDGEVCNSTRTKSFQQDFPDRFCQMYIAEQNMIGVA